MSSPSNYLRPDFDSPQELKLKRLRALETLESFNNRTPHLSATTDKSKYEEDKLRKTPGFDRTDYVSYNGYKTLNITDLQDENTINLESTNKLKSSIDNKVSFEPSEITGRSTCCRGQLLKKSKEMSVEEILATSFSGNVRNLSELLRTNSIGTDIDSSFTPAELMNSKLAADEQAWQQEYAPIPTNPISTYKSKSEQNKNIYDKNDYDFSISSSFYSNNISEIDNYFHKRSENLSDVLGLNTSPERHNPVGLLENSTKSISDSRNDQMQNNSLRNHQDEQNNDEYLFSLSSIANALNKISMNDSVKTIMNRLMLPKNTKNPSAETEHKKILSNSMSANKTTEKQQFMDVMDKENIDPSLIVSENELNEFCDTASLTESFLDCSDFQKMTDSKTYNISEKDHTMRIPLVEVNEGSQNQHNDSISPIRNVTKPTPILQNQRRSKSPCNLHELYAVAGASANKLQSLDKKSLQRKRSHSATRNKSEITNPTISLQEFRSPNNNKNLTNKHSSTRLKHDLSNHKEFSSKFNKMSNNLRTPSPISTSEKNKSTNSYNFNSTRSSIYSQNSPVSPVTLEASIKSMRRYQKAGSSIATSPGSDINGKISLPNYGLCVPDAMPSTRSNSQCSSSSEYCHREGKTLPIKVTCMRFSWGSVKLRTNSTKSMQIKNYSPKRLVLKVQINGPGFQILNLDANGNIITLQSQECRTIVLNFCPTVLGTAIGQLYFLPPNKNQSPMHKIPLYGYGGHTVVIPQGIQKGPSGLPFITMGELKELSHPLVRTFSIYNKGPLDAFAVICLSSLNLELPRLSDCIEIIPKKVLIQSGDTVTFKITFKPRRDDLKKIIKKIDGVMTLTKLQIITGDEPTRQRIRNSIQQMNEREKFRLTSTSLNNCWNKFPDERNICELDSFKEQADVATELLSTLRTHEIAITLNHYVIDDTVNSTNLMFPDIDETVMFRTIVSNSIYLGSPGDDSKIDDNVQMWSVRPNILEIDPFNSLSKSIFSIQSFYKTSQYFEITANYKHLFLITPNCGQLLPGEDITVTVSFTKISFLPVEDIYITVFMEKEKIKIPVKIKKDNFPPNLR